jgi:hypothetical protein
VDHSILLKKLSKLGVRGIELKWFESYLSDCQQFVLVNGQSSSLLHILLGVPQGSNLGPLLFLIYINDLPNCSSLLSLLFADDTTLSASHSNLDTLLNLVYSEFKKVVFLFSSPQTITSSPENKIHDLFSLQFFKQLAILDHY